MDHRASLLNAMPHLRHDKPTTNAPSQLHSPYGLPITDHCVGCNFRKRGFFCSLSAEAIQALDRIKHVAAYPPGAVIFVQDQVARGVFIVCEGQVKLMSTTTQGKAIILRFAGSGDNPGIVVSDYAEKLRPQGGDDSARPNRIRSRRRVRRLSEAK